MSDLDCKDVYPKKPRYTKRHGDFLTKELNNHEEMRINANLKNARLVAKVRELDKIIGIGKKDNGRLLRMLTDIREEMHVSDKCHRHEIVRTGVILSNQEKEIKRLETKIQTIKQSVRLSLSILETGE